MIIELVMQDELIRNSNLGGKFAVMFSSVSRGHYHRHEEASWWYHLMREAW